MAPTDVVFVLPGITGSVLKKDGRPVWSASPGALVDAIRTFGRNIAALKLDDDIGDRHPDDKVEAVALMPAVHFIPGVWTPVHGYSSLLGRLEGLRLQDKIGAIVPFPYDWRLSNRYNAQVLSRTVELELGRWRASDPSRTDAMAVFVCHSMGGLIARWYVEKLGGAEVTRKVITLGTPYRGAARAVDQLVNGVRKGFGRLSVDLSDFARSMPSSYQLLPSYACVDEQNTLRNLDEVALPNIDGAKLRDALAFNRELADAERLRAASLEMTHAIVGVKQPTATTVRRTDTGVEILETITGRNDFGDATVPLAGALGHGLKPSTNAIVRVVDSHGHLQANSFAFDQIEAVLTAVDVVYLSGEGAVAQVDVPEIVLAGDDLVVNVAIEPRLDGRDRPFPVPAVVVTIKSEEGTRQFRQPEISDGRARAVFSTMAPGGYEVRVSGRAAGTLTEVVNTVLVWDAREPVG